MIWWFKKAKKSTKFFFVWFWLLPYFIKKNIMKFFPSNFSFLYFTLSINKFILFHFFYFILISGNFFSFPKCLIFNLCVFGIVLRVLFLVLITSVILCVCVFLLGCIQTEHIWSAKSELEFVSPNYPEQILSLNTSKRTNFLRWFRFVS